MTTQSASHLTKKLLIPTDNVTYSASSTPNTKLPKSPFATSTSKLQPAVGSPLHNLRLQKRPSMSSNSPLVSSQHVQEQSVGELEEQNEFEGIPQERLKLPPELDAALGNVFTKRDPLDDNEFDPVEHINIIFPTEQSLSTIDVVLEKLRKQIRLMEKELADLINSQTDAGNTSKVAIEQATNAIQTLMKRISQIKESAKQSDQVVHELTRDIKSLDQSKKNLTVSVTVLKRLRILVTAVEQTKILSAKRQYTDCIPLIQVMRQLQQYFKQYRTVHRISTLCDNVQSTQTELKKQIMREFENAFSSGTLRTQITQLNEACGVISVMEQEAKEKLIEWYCDVQLKDYRGIFRGNQEVAGLDNVTRRHAWLKRLLKTYDEEHVGIFPEEWKVAECLCVNFCSDTRKDLAEILARLDSNMDVTLMLQALQSTLEFEEKLERRFGGLEVLQSFDESDAESAARESNEEFTTSRGSEGKSGGKFYRSMSEAFEPYLRHHINSEDKKLSEMIDGYRTKPIQSDEEVVLQSSTDLFIFYRQSILFFSKLSVGKPFWDLSRMFGKWLRTYGDVLLAKLPKDDKKAIQEEDIRTICLIINTAEYCSTTTEQLEEKLKDKIEPAFKSMINFSSENENFMNVAGIAIKSLVKGIENCVEPALIAAARKSWGNIQSVGDQSDYVTTVATTLSSSITFIRKYIPETNIKYFRTFCDKFAESFLAKFHGNIFKCRPISEVGAEQMLLDTHALKTILMQMINIGTESTAPPPQMYIKVLTKAVTKIEQLLKVIMNPIDPPEMLVNTYMVLFNDPSVSNFIKTIELKGLKRTDHQLLVDTFQSIALKTSPEQQTNPITTTNSTSNIPLSFSSPFLTRLQTSKTSDDLQRTAQTTTTTTTTITEKAGNSGATSPTASTTSGTINTVRPAVLGAAANTAKEEFGKFMFRKMNFTTKSDSGNQK